MSASPRPQLKDARRQFWWGEHDLIDYGVIARVGTSAWAVYTCLLRHVNDEGSTFPSVPLLMAETGLSNRVIAQSVAKLKTARLIDVDRASHQWNIYIILDVTHAIRKNGWERVEKKARDEKSPASKSFTNAKQVMKSHMAHDESSPEQVTNRHPKKNQLKRTKDEGGVKDVTGDARARNSSRPLAPVFERESTTTTDPSGQKPQPPQTTGSWERHPPLGGAAGAAEAALSVNLRHSQGAMPLTSEQPIAVQEVPRAAAGALMALEPLSTTELDSRAVGTVAGASYGLLASLVGGKKVLEGGLLNEVTPTGALDRKLWLRLSTTELESIRIAAQADARASGVSFRTLAIRGLDRLIGASPVLKDPVRAASITLPGAYLTKAEKQAQQSGHPPVLPGQQWASRKTGATFTISDVTTESVIVEGVGEYTLQKFHNLFAHAD